jgi:hypothetical protein
MLRGNYPAEAKMQAERCKPDYESMIKAARAELLKATAFLDAIFEFTGNREHDGKLAELIGEVYSITRMYESSIERLIKEQESEQ